MKKYLLLPLLVLGGLISCQQELPVTEVSENEFRFEGTFEVATRSSAIQLVVISLCAETERMFSVFDLVYAKKPWKDYV